MLKERAARQRRRVTLTKKLDRAEAQRLCDELNSYGIGHDIRQDGGLFLVEVPSPDLALARALTGIAGMDPPKPRATDTLLLRRAAVLPLVAGGLFAMVWGYAGVLNDSGGEVEGYRGRVYHADDDHDGRVDRMVVFGPEGLPISVLHDEDRDGLMDRYLSIRPNDVSEWVDHDGDGIPERGR